MSRAVAALACAVTSACVLSLLAGTAAAQSVRYRRPFFGGRSISAHFDHSGGGCTDYACGGVCYDGHTGTDYPMPIGTAVVAAASGTVVAAFNGCSDSGYYGNPCGGRCGNHVVIQHGDGSRSTYCHMRNGSHRVGVGSSVSCGTVIGESASSGSSTGPHLHFGHRTGGAGSSSDPYAGSCSRSTSVWVEQGGYRGNPGDTCSDACSPSAESCNGRDEDCDGRVDEDVRRSCGTDVGECVAGTEVCSGGAWSACAGAVGPSPEVCDVLDNDCDGVSDDEQICEREEVAHGGPFYGGSEDSDASGDGRADACAVTSGAFSCMVGSEHGFLRTLGGGDLDAGDLFTASVIRMGDLDGDGAAEACGRQGDRLVCWRSNGVSFAEIVLGPAALTLTHLGLVDVDGDGRLDACVRDASGLACHRGDGNGFRGIITLPALGDAGGFANIVHHGSIRFADLDGDGRTDVCARDATGLSCWRSEGDHFGERILGPRWSDAAGFDALSRWSTLRMADVSGDGRADACIRLPEGFGCVVFDGRAFQETMIGPPSTAAHERVEVYSTLRFADLDGDGRSDLCLREPEGIRCWLAGERGFDRVAEGPSLSDAAGWTVPARYRSIRLADVSGDGHADVCALDGAALRCWLFDGHVFDRTWIALSMSDGSLATDGARATLRISGGRNVHRGAVGGLGCSARPTRGSGLVGVLGFLLLLSWCARCALRSSARSAPRGLESTSSSS